jgi:hypothetical protein
VIPEKVYREAIQAEEDAEKIIHQYHREKQEGFDRRLKESPVFTDKEYLQRLFKMSLWKRPWLS